MSQPGSLSELPELVERRVERGGMRRWGARGVRWTVDQAIRQQLAARAAASSRDHRRRFGNRAAGEAR